MSKVGILKIWHFDGVTNYESVFSGTRNLVIYSDCDKIKEIIINNNCIALMKNMNWQNSLKKYDIETNQCFNDNCEKYNKSDYHSKCYSIYPNGTYNDNFL